MFSCINYTGNETIQENITVESNVKTTKDMSTLVLTDACKLCIYDEMSQKFLTNLQLYNHSIVFHLYKINLYFTFFKPINDL